MKKRKKYYIFSTDGTELDGTEINIFSFFIY